jgi:hypothetical protein
MKKLVSFGWNQLFTCFYKVGILQKQEMPANLPAFLVFFFFRKTCPLQYVNSVAKMSNSVYGIAKYIRICYHVGMYLVNIYK